MSQPAERSVAPPQYVEYDVEVSAFVEDPPRVDVLVDGAPLPVAQRFVRDTPSAVWTLVHGLGFWPNVTVVDSAGSSVEGEITYVDRHTIRVEFSAAFAGEAYLS